MPVHAQIREYARQAFHDALPEGWRVISIQSLPVPGSETDHEVARITNGVETSFLGLEDGQVVTMSRRDMEERLTEYKTLLEVGTSWLRGVGVAA